MEWNVNLKSGWVESESKYSRSDNLKLGKVTVASVFYYDSITKGSDLKYALTTQMGGIKSHLGYYETAQQAKDKAELVLAHWINKFLCDNN